MSVAASLGSPKIYDIDGNGVSEIVVADDDGFVQHAWSVITSYSIHYTKLYDAARAARAREAGERTTKTPPRATATRMKLKPRRWDSRAEGAPPRATQVRAPAVKPRTARAADQREMTRRAAKARTPEGTESRNNFV